MLLIKKIAVYINILNCSIIKYFTKELSRNDINLTPEQYLVMDILWDADVMSQQSIADIIQKDKNSVTKFIDSLEKKGLVYRVVNKEDRRVNNIMVSEEGKKLKTKTTEVAIKMMRNVLDNIKEEDLMAFDKVMMQIKDNIDGAIRNVE
ncbi:MAG: MarR family transcriptional regulator [Bacteroidales bacterium]|nr:MarR family transcriptional regulator [Bacteroidales bacterium]